MPLFARAIGEGAEPVVLLHGFGGTHAAWDMVVDALSPDVPLLVYDLPGHGESHDFPDAGPAKLAAQAILADLAERGIARAHLAGHSMGGAVAALMGIIEGARVASLTLLSPGGFGPEINHRLLTRYAAAQDEASILTCLEAMYGWMSPVSEKVVRESLAARASPGRVETLVRIAQGLVRDGRQGQLPRDRLEGLAMPVAVVWGQLDNVLPVRHARGLPWPFGVHIFPDLGHMLPQEAPAECAAIIRRTAGLRR
ncbi:alpha/beta fold hydrolase [Mesorhizobium sp. CAU 1741]|uniref:alpha/beta fold hydrolase n=1 Tax=Mesorhizobium sp. CAU 1741 TaxID=3140366 RepID=UPI00325B8302